jgi:hypothetical protein
MPDAQAGRRLSPARRRLLDQLALLALGGGAIALASVAGRSDLIAAVFEPPPAARLLLALAAVMLGVVAILRAADRMRTSDGDARALIRSVRLIFLAVAAFAAAGGWIVGTPVPIVAALIIAGIDLLETTFLLLVTAANEPAPGAASEAGQERTGGSAKTIDDPGRDGDRGQRSGRHEDGGQRPARDEDEGRPSAQRVSNTLVGFRMPSGSRAALMPRMTST